MLLGFQDPALLTSFLRSTIEELAMSFVAMDSLQATVTNLKMGKKHGLLLVEVRKELVNHPAVQVRRYTANLLGVSQLEILCAKRLFCGLITFS